MAIISERSIEKVRLELESLRRSGADPMEVLADLNGVLWMTILDSIRMECGSGTIPEKELLEACREIALLGRRDAPNREEIHRNR
jgi:hypothetical protein